MADEKDQRRGAPDKEELKPAAHEHRFTSMIDNPADPPKREVCEVCGATRPVK